MWPGSEHAGAPLRRPVCPARRPSATSGSSAQLHTMPRRRAASINAQRLPDSLIAMLQPPGHAPRSLRRDVRVAVLGKAVRSRSASDRHAVGALPRRRRARARTRERVPSADPSVARAIDRESSAAGAAPAAAGKVRASPTHPTATAFIADPEFTLSSIGSRRIILDGGSSSTVQC